MVWINLLNFGAFLLKLFNKIDDALNRLVKDKVKSLINLLKKPTSTTLLSEEVKTALEKAVYEKEDRRYLEALQVVDEVLKDDPNIPEATFIKAAILWEGFKDPYTAKLGLQRVKELVPKKNDRLNHMASELIEEIERSRNVK